MSSPSARILISAVGLERGPVVLERLGPRIEWVRVEQADELSTKLRDMAFDAVLLEHRPPATIAWPLLESLHKIDPGMPVILLDAAPSVANAAQSLRCGAADYLPAPYDDAALSDALQRVLRDRRRDAEHQLLLRQVERSYTSFEDIIGSSAPMQKVFATIERVAGSNVDVLITGPTGTGKELIARAIHRRSSRVDKPFIPVDCGAIPDNLIESELFGHERGAFTGADSRRIGLLEFADGGTVFFDELGELPQAMQSKLLRTLQERKVRRVGGREEIDVDLRIVAATSRDLDAMIKAGQFREDLYYRVNVVRIELPPLRERGDDLGLLAEYFVHKHSREMGKAVVGMAPEAYQVLKQYPWPGNVRELQNVIRRALALTKSNKLSVDDLPDEVVTAAGSRESPVGVPQGYFQLRDEYVARFERQYLGDLLTRHRGDVPAAAREAKLPRGTLYRLLKNHDLDPGGYR